MSSLLTGYAGAFNRRHERSGQLFQNRYKSIVCEKDTYFLELVRYLHLNSLRAGLVKDLCELERYRYCGHGALSGAQVREWQDTETVLVQFGQTLRRARAQYSASAEHDDIPPVIFQLSVPFETGVGGNNAAIPDR